MRVTHPSDRRLRDVGAPAPRVVLGIIHLMAPHPILNGSDSHDVVKYSWVTRQRVLIEFLAGLQQVTARHVFGDIQHMTHNLGLQGKWIHFALQRVIPGKHSTLATSAEAGATLLRKATSHLKGYVPELTRLAHLHGVDPPLNFHLPFG